MEEWKGKLEESMVQLSDDTHRLEKQSLKDILSLLRIWNWKLTAAEFFVINRGLASGVSMQIQNYKLQIPTNR